MESGDSGIHQFAHKHYDLWTASPHNELILLVEDDEHLRELLATILRGDGYQVVELGDGIEALHYLAASAVFNHMLPAPDLIISDIRMPGYTGLDLLAGMAESIEKAPIMLITGVLDPEIREEAARFGVDAFLTKPFDNDELRGIVKQILQRA